MGAFPWPVTAGSGQGPRMGAFPWAVTAGGGQGPRMAGDRDGQEAPRVLRSP